MKVKETQPVHLLSCSDSPSSSASEMSFIGNVTHKLNLKLELEASKAEAIRQRSQEAEKERLSRKTVELDSSTKINGNVGQKRLIRRNSASSTTTGSNALARNNNYPLRTRVLQLLAIEPISLELLIKTLSLSNTQDLKTIIPELCGQNFNPKSLILRQEFYGEVKVADWPFYSLRERSQVSRTISKSSTTPININSTITATPPETPETPSPKKQTFSSHFPSVVARTSAPSSAKKGTSAKDRLTAIMKKRR